MPYWRLFYHVIWSTRDWEPMIDEEIERVIVRSIRTSASDHGAILHAVGLMPDHAHVAASIPPKVSISTFVGRLKGASAHAVNASMTAATDNHFGWQAEFGVLSFGEKALPDVVSYVQNQRSRHATGRLWAALEQAGEPERAPSEK